jgi:hypothetical protein
VCRRDDRSLGLFRLARKLRRRHPRAADRVPTDKVRLAEIVLQPAYPVMRVVVRRIVRKEALERVERQRVSAVVVDCLERRQSKQDHRLSDSHSC